MRGFVRSLIVMHGATEELEGGGKTKQKSHPALPPSSSFAFNQTKRTDGHRGQRMRKRSGSIVNAEGQECLDAVGRLAKYETSVTQPTHQFIALLHCTNTSMSLTTSQQRREQCKEKTDTYMQEQHGRCRFR